MNVCCCLRHPACNAHAPYCHLWPVRIYNVYPHYLINSTILEKKLLSIKCVFRFFSHLWSEKVIILRRTGRDVVKTYIDVHVKYPLFLSNFNETWIFSTDFRKIPKYKISWKSIHWEPSCSMWTKRRMDKYDEADSFFS